MSASEATKDMCMLAFDRLSTELGEIPFPVPDDVIYSLRHKIQAAGEGTEILAHVDSDRSVKNQGGGSGARGGSIDSFFSTSGTSDQRGNSGGAVHRDPKHLPSDLLAQLYGVDASKKCPLFVTWEKTDASTAAIDEKKWRSGARNLESKPGDGGTDANYDLRGCIGNLSARPLSEIEDYALTAALRDRRFQPVRREELPQLRVSVSLLTDYEKCEPWEWSDWDIDTHGILISFTCGSTGQVGLSTCVSVVFGRLFLSSLLLQLTRERLIADA